MSDLRKKHCRNSANHGAYLKSNSSGNPPIQEIFDGKNNQLSTARQKFSEDFVLFEAWRIFFLAFIFKGSDGVPKLLNYPKPMKFAHGSTVVESFSL